MDSNRKNQILSAITVISFIIAIVSLWYAVHTSNESSNVLAELNDKLSVTQNELNKTKSELINVRIELVDTNEEFENVIKAGTKEILLAIYEADSFGFNNESRETFFQTKFNFSYEKALNILKYSSTTDDYELAFSSLIHGDYSTSLHHFDISLIKYPTDNKSKIGKSAALIGLNRPNESREILFELESVYDDKKLVSKLIGDSYYIEGEYSKSVDYYIKSLGYYFTEDGKKDISGLNLFVKTCEIEADGLFDSPYISITELSDGWKIGEVIVEDLEIIIESKYKVS